MEAEYIATAASDAATEFFQAYQYASVDMAASIDDVVVTSVLFAPTRDLVVFSDNPSGSHYAWVDDRQYIPQDEARRREFAQLSLLGDLVLPSDYVAVPGRKDLAQWFA